MYPNIISDGVGVLLRWPDRSLRDEIETALRQGKKLFLVKAKQPKPKPYGAFFHGPVELKEDRDAIRASLKTNRERRTVRVKSKLP